MNEAEKKAFELSNKELLKLAVFFIIVGAIGNMLGIWLAQKVS